MSPSDPELDRSGPGADLRRILDGLPDAVGVLQGTRAVFANRALLELAGVDGLDELNRSSLLRDGFSEVDRASLVEVISGVSDGPVEVCLRRVAGGSTSLEILAYPVGFKGEPARCFVARDQTAVKTIEAGLVHTDRLASIGSLAAGVAHEINNPLSFVMYGLDEIAEGMARCQEAYGDLFARLIERFDAAEVRAILAESGAAACAARVEELRTRALEGAQGSRRIQRIVTDLRSLARADDGGKLRRLEPTELVAQAVRLTRHSLRHECRLTVQTASTEAVMGNEGRLVQVLVNLLVNAGQAVAGAGGGAIGVDLAHRGDQIVFEVTDDGPGIEPSAQPHLFEAFFTTKAAGEGSGLGLWICRDIVREHGGRLDVESAPGEGATFRMSLPVAGPPRVGEASHSSGLWTVGSGPARVLLVDDEPLVLAAMRRVLGRRHRVKAVRSAVEAKALLEKRPERFDVVLCDLMMEDMTGMELFRWIEGAVPRLAQRFAVVSGGAVTRDAREFLDSAPVPALMKPVDPKVLRRAVDALHTGAPWPGRPGDDGAER
jgi:signal transduction histidine kinase/ActR/RegA family two-component response regulator